MPEYPYLALLVLKTHQIERLRSCYGILGIEFKEEQHGSGPMHFAGLVGELIFEIYPLKEGEFADTTTRLGFTVSNLNETLERMTRAGVPIASDAKQTPWGYRAVVRDPDGRSVELTSVEQD